MGAAQLKTVFVVDGAPMDNRTISEKLVSFTKEFRSLSCRIQAFAEEVEIDRVKQQADTGRFEYLNHLRSTLNKARLDLESARYAFFDEKISLGPID